MNANVPGHRIDGVVESTDQLGERIRNISNRTLEGSAAGMIDRINALLGETRMTSDHDINREEMT